jgi:hypothetical protein
MSAATPLQGAMHTREQFEVMVNAPVDIAWPLFGAHGERAWAADWHPIFIWPAMANDVAGMVFKITHGDQTAVWVNTAFDRTANRIQYVYVLPEVVVTVITLQLRPAGASTHIEVTYERTALADSANDSVSQMAERDRAAGPEWSQQINRHLRCGTSAPNAPIQPCPPTPCRAFHGPS